MPIVASFEQGVSWHSGNYRVWKLLKTTKSVTHSRHNSKHFHCLWTKSFWLSHCWSYAKKLFVSSVSLNKNADIDKYSYSGYGIGFDRKSTFSFPNGRFGQDVINFGIDMTSSAHVDNKKKYILILGKGPAQGLELTLTDCRKNVFD